MWVVLSLVASAYASTDPCSLSCGLLNAPDSCYVSSGCTGSGSQLPVSGKFIAEVQEWMGSIAKNSDCDLDEFEKCQLVDLQEYADCAASANCQALSDFRVLVENIPPHLWVAVQPRILTNLVTENYDTTIFNEMNECTDLCFKGAQSMDQDQGHEFFKLYDRCAMKFCEVGLIQIKQKCLENCAAKETDGVSQEECKELECMEFTSSKIPDNGDSDDSDDTDDDDDSTDICKSSCYDGDSLDWQCFKRCKENARGDHNNEEHSGHGHKWDENEHKRGEEHHRCADEEGNNQPRKPSNCGDTCFTECYIDGNLDKKCMKGCYGLCDGNDRNGRKLASNKQAKENSDERVGLGVGPTNCGQICFQQCYVNFQMISGCYLPCVQQCVGFGIEHESSKHPINEKKIESKSVAEKLASKYSEAKD